MDHSTTEFVGDLEEILPTEIYIVVRGTHNHSVHFRKEDADAEVEWCIKNLGDWDIWIDVLTYRK